MGPPLHMSVTLFTSTHMSDGVFSVGTAGFSSLLPSLLLGIFCPSKSFLSTRCCNALTSKGTPTQFRKHDAKQASWATRQHAPFQPFLAKLNSVDAGRNLSASLPPGSRSRGKELQNEHRLKQPTWSYKRPYGGLILDPSST